MNDMASLLRLWCVVVLGLAAPVAYGATVHGKIDRPLPLSANQAVRPAPLGFWRLDNGQLPITTVPATLPQPAIVVLVPHGPVPLSPERRSIETRSLTFEPRLVVAPAGSTIELYNGGQNPRPLYLEGGEPLLEARPLASGERRSLVLALAGEYHLRDAGRPQASATLVIVDTPYFALTDEHDDFTIDAPSGSYTLKTYFDGRWSSGEPLTVGRNGLATVRASLPAMDAETHANSPQPASGSAASIPE